MGFLEGLRALCDASGALLVFDEVISGFRVARGGAQELYGVRPDLTVLGKIAGGGLPLAAFGGRADVLDELAPAGPIFHAGTLSGNPLATAAALTVLRRLRDHEVYARLEETAAALEEGLRHEDVTVQRVGSMLTVFFRRDPVRNLVDAQAADGDRYGALLPASARAGGLRGAVAVRSTVRLDRSRAARGRAHGGGRAGVPCRLASRRSGRRSRVEAERESPLWAAALRPEGSREAVAVFSPLADERFALGVESIYEGYLLHYGRSRLFSPADRDGAILLGDYLYAHGLVRITTLGDVERGRAPRRAALALRASAGPGAGGRR